MAFDAGFVAAIVHELQRDLVGAKIEKVMQPDKDAVVFQVHPDKGEADVKARIGLDLLHDHGIGEGCVCPCGKGTACLGLRHNIYGLGKRYGSALGNYGAVKVLAALDGKEQTLAFGVIVKAFEYFLCHGGIGIGSDFGACYLAGGAAHNDEAAFLKLCFFAKFGDGGFCLFVDSVHNDSLISIIF